MPMVMLPETGVAITAGAKATMRDVAVVHQ